MENEKFQHNRFSQGMPRHQFLTVVLIMIVWLIICFGTIELLLYMLSTDMNYVNTVFVAGSAIGQVLLAGIAYWKLPALERENQAAHATEKARFLLSLAEQWIQDDLVQARCLLHQQALYSSNTDEIPQKISDYIITVSKNPDAVAIRQFSQIISLLEFMEALGCLYFQNYITLSSIQAFFGGSVERYFYYLRGYINFRREHGSPPGLMFKSDASLYRHYENLVLLLKSQYEAVSSGAPQKNEKNHPDPL